MDGDVLSWSKAKWNVTNMVAIEKPYEEFCQEQGIGRSVLFQQKTDFTNAIALCQKFKGKLPLINDEQHQSEIFNTFKNDSECSKGKLNFHKWYFKYVLIPYLQQHRCMACLVGWVC